jgi:hypothetical protein
MILPDKGRKGLSYLKLGMYLRGSGLGLMDLKKSIKMGSDADNTATNLYQTAKALYDSGNRLHDLKKSKKEE